MNCIVIINDIANTKLENWQLSFVQRKSAFFMILLDYPVQSCVGVMKHYCLIRNHEINSLNCQMSY